MKSGDTDLDVAVIGGGVSGAYCAWRLIQSGARPIGLFEYGKRIGGRLFSATLPGAPHIHCELGGMRFIKDQHLLVQSLVGALNLATAPFLMGNPAPGPDGRPIADRNNYMYLRDKHLLVSELSDSTKVPYNVNWAERDKNPDQLQAYVMNLLVPDADNLKAEQWFDVDVFGNKLYKYGYWNLLYRVLSSEAYSFMKDACGYDANVANANAVLQLPATEYADTTMFLKLRDGYQKLPVSLAEQFERGGGVLKRNHRLVSIESTGAGAQRRYQLSFHPTETDDNDRTRDAPDARETVVTARRVILAMPRRSIELIDWAPLRAPDIHKRIKSVLIQKAFKLFLGYRHPWWKALGLVAGRSITDMPVRQIYYLGSEGDTDGAAPEERLNSVLMASYSDIGDVPFWKGLETVDDEDVAAITAMAAPVRYNQHAPRSVPYRASRQMVDMAQKQIAQIHGQIELPPAYAAIYHEWGGDPYGGGWHEWKAGFRYFEVMKAIRQPVRGEDVFICGEAYSNNQGWVEGALQTAEHVLQDQFGLKRPDWMPVEAELGP